MWRAIFQKPLLIRELCKACKIWRANPLQLWPNTNIQAQVCLSNGNRKTLRRLERLRQFSSKGYAIERRIQIMQRLLRMMRICCGLPTRLAIVCAWNNVRQRLPAEVPTTNILNILSLKSILTCAVHICRRSKIFE